MVEVLANSLNNPTTTLNGSITSGSASLTVFAPTAPDVWPTTGTFRVKVDLELITVTAASGGATSLTVVSRGVEGTTAASHSSGASVDLVATAAAIDGQSLSQFAAPTADLSIGTHKLTNVVDPASAQDAATKNYVDTALNGLFWKQACRLATASALPSNVYANGASGVGATLTGVAFGALSIDGSVVVIGDRVLVKNEVTGANNGIYVVTTVGAVATLYVLTRAADYNQTSEIQAGDAVYVTAGTANVDTSWVQTTTGAITVGTTALVFTQFGGNLVSSVFGRAGAVVAATNDYTYAQIAASANAIAVSNIAAGTAGQVLGGTGPTYALPPGFEIKYTQITSGVNVTSTTEATGTTILSPGAVVFDGTPVLVQFFAQVLTPNVSVASFVIISLFEGSTQITRLAVPTAGSASAAQGDIPVSAFFRFTPSAASHTYTVTASVNSTTGTPQIHAGAGGTGSYPPAFIRFTKV